MSMFSSLSGLFGKESPLKYDVLEERAGGWGWHGRAHHAGKAKEGGEDVSVFVFKASR